MLDYDEENDGWSGLDSDEVLCNDTMDTIRPVFSISIAFASRKLVAW